MGLPVPVLAESSSGFSCDDAQLGREITLLSAQINVASYQLLKMIAEFDVRGAWRCGGSVRSCAHWLAAQCGMSIGAARERVRVARSMVGLSEVDRAFSAGGLSYSKVRAITRVATKSNESFLVAMAEQASASHLEKLVGKYQPVDELGLSAIAGAVDDELLGGGASGLEPGASAGSGSGSAAAAAAGEADTGLAVGASSDGNVGEKIDEASDDVMDEERRREQLRQLYWFQDDDGMWIIHAKLPPEQGQLVVKALEAVSRPLQEERMDEWKAIQKSRMQAVARHLMSRHRNEDSGVNPGACSAGETEAGSVEAERAEEEVEAEEVKELVDSIPASVEYERAQEKISAETFSQFMNQLRADAFAGMAEHLLATLGDYPHAQLQLKGLKGAERCQVVLHVDINTLRTQRSGVCCEHGKAHFEEKPWLSPTTARRLSCDASLVTVLEDEAGKVLNVGRRSRIVPANIRRALQERDGVCRYPGCHESRYVDAHHIQHWADGGETSLENLVTLCRFHHRQLHSGSFDIRLGEEGGAVLVGKNSAEMSQAAKVRGKTLGESRRLRAAGGENQLAPLLSNY